jgi:hypothetical protein
MEERITDIVMEERITDELEMLLEGSSHSLCNTPSLHCLGGLRIACQNSAKIQIKYFANTSLQHYLQTNLLYGNALLILSH